MQFYDAPNVEFQNIVVDYVESKKIDPNILDVRVADVLHVKELLGLFDKYLTDDLTDVVNSEQHQKLALEAARESIILLKNKDNLLP
ncbi:hypothetical protein AKO1_007378, partial [Acrasis kona]